MAALLVLGTAAARAEESGQPASAAPARLAAYPLFARIHLGAEALARRYEHDPSFGGPPNASSTVEIGAQTQRAYADAARRMFREDPTLGLERIDVDVSVSAADLEADAGWWRAYVAHVVVVRDAGGTEIATVRVEGDAPVPGLDAGAVPEAFARAAAAAARAFTTQLEASPAMKAFLAARGIGPRVVARPSPPPPAAPAARGKLLVFLDTGGSFSSATQGSALGITARAGVSTPFLLVQATLDAWQASFSANPGFGGLGSPNGDASLVALAAGIDVAAVVRPRPALELRFGVGGHLLRGTATMDYALVRLDGGLVRSKMTMDAAGTMASVFGGFVYTPSSRWRPRIGLELRQFQDGRLRFHALGREVAPAETSVLLLLGLERSLWSE